MNTNCSFKQNRKKKKKKKETKQKEKKKNKNNNKCSGGGRVSTTGWMTWSVCFQKPHQIVNSI